MTSNPFLQDWQTPFEVPPFADITAEHYGPALDKAFEDHLAEVEAIASTTDPVTFQNTIDALELAGELLRKPRLSSTIWRDRTPTMRCKPWNASLPPKWPNTARRSACTKACLRASNNCGRPRTRLTCPANRRGFLT